MIVAVRTRLTFADAGLFGRDWETMRETIDLLARHGIMFDTHFETEETRRRGIDIFPELTLYDTHYQPHHLRFGQWVVVHTQPDGHNPSVYTTNFRILDGATYLREYQVLAEELEDA